MENWKEYKIGDLCEVGRGSSPRPIIDQRYFVDGDIPWIKIADATASGKYIFKTKEYVNEFGASFSRYLEPNSLIIAASGVSLGQIKFLGVKGCIHDGWLYVSKYNEELIDKEYLYYFLINYSSTFHNFSSGAAIQNINTEILRNTKIKLPSIPSQQKIASILSSYDELIENNKQRIKLLEEMAEEIYKEWFVRLRFPDYENTKIVDGLPEGWEKMRLDNVLETVKRKPKISTDKYLSEGKYPIIDQGDDFIAGYTNDENLVQFEPLPLLVFGDHTRRIKFINYPFVSGADGTQLLSPKNKNLLPIYFYISVKNIDLSNFHYARHFKFLKQEYIIIPDNKRLLQFNNLVSSFYEEIQVLKDKNQLLQETRDLLLPRLISGKLSVEHLIEEELKMVAEPTAEYK